MERRWFEVWILGYDKDMMCTDIEELVGEFATKERAFEQAQNLTLDSIFEEGYVDPESLIAGDTLAIIVEEVYEPEFDVCQAVASWEIKYLEY